MNNLRISAAACSLLFLVAGAGPALAARKPEPTPPPPTYPPARFWHSMTSNGAAGGSVARIYMFGGNGGFPDTRYLNDLWSYSAATGLWTLLAPTGLTWPQLGRGNGALSCGDGKCVVFAGTSGTKALNETWYFAEPTGTNNAVSWSQVSCRKPAACPSPRHLPLMAFDPTRHYHVSFGGDNDVGPGGLGDTWTFNGTSWTRRLSSSAVPVRSFGSAVFVPSHVSNGNSITVDKVVIFGGDPYPNAPYPDPLCDLWAWNGSDWDAIAAPDPKPCLVGATMGWDKSVPASPRLVVTGGFPNAGGGSPNTDTWYFSFTGPGSGAWSKASLSVCAPIAFARGAHDAPSQKFVFFGGSDGWGNAFANTMTCP